MLLLLCLVAALLYLLPFPTDALLMRIAAMSRGFLIYSLFDAFGPLKQWDAQIIERIRMARKKA